MKRSPLSRIPGAAVMALVLFLASCREGGGPTAPSVQARGGNGLTVSSVVPDNSKRGVTLDITVNGSGFDQGSSVRLERGGVPAGGITTNATTFVSPKKLTANITIAATADTGKYDVAVTTSGGRKGVGIELFLVEYELAELGIIGGTWSLANGINDHGEVVGTSCTADCLATAFYWSEADGLVDLGTMPGYSRSAAQMINSRGQVFGEVRCLPADPGCGGIGRTTLVRWDRIGGGWTITPVQGCSSIRPAGDQSGKFLINNTDQCVHARSGNLVVQTLSGGTVVQEEPLPPVFPDGWHSAGAISDALMVAGVATDAAGRRASVVWYRNASGSWAFLQLGVPAGDQPDRLTDVSEPDAAGTVRVSGHTVVVGAGGRVLDFHAVRWTLARGASGAWQVASTEILPAASRGGAYPHDFAIAVNRAGEAVGISNGLLTGAGVAVKWSVAGGVEALPGPGRSGEGRAVDINAQGWIVGAVWDPGNKCERAAIWRQR